VRAAPALLIALAACSSEAPEPAAPSNQMQAPPAAAVPKTARPQPAAEAPAPPTPTAATEEQAARAVVQSYFDRIEAGDYDAAWALRWTGEGDDAGSRQAFVDNFARYAEHHATVGAPGPVEGAAGSLYAEVPVQLYGRLKSGEPFSSAGTVTLRRVNDVPGSSAEQRRWRIYSRD
jgi:hypothetical protein